MQLFSTSSQLFHLLESPASFSPSPGSEKLSVRRMVSLIRQIGGDAEGETDGQQRRLRRMLEETLTKNMHLQVRYTYNKSQQIC